MKKFNKKDLLYIWIINLVFLGIVYYLTKNMYFYGSNIDWNAQNILIADYF